MKLNTHACKCTLDARNFCKCKDLNVLIPHGSVPREDFCGGFAKLGVATVDALRAKLPALRAELASPAFVHFWLWSYGFHCEAKQKVPKMDLLIDLFRTILPPARFPLLDDLISFLGTRKGSITKDAWTQVLPFGAALAAAGFKAGTPGSGDFDAITGDAWPSLFDEFVEHAKKRQGPSGGGGAAAGGI